MRVAVGLHGNTRVLQGPECFPICDALEWLHSMIEEVCLTDELRWSKDNCRSRETLENRDSVFQK